MRQTDLKISQVIDHSAIYLGHKAKTLVLKVETALKSI